MAEKKSPGGLNDQEIERLTRQLPGSLDARPQIGEKHFMIIADIGDRLANTRKTLDDEAWLCWLKSIKYTSRQAEKFINIARFRKVKGNAVAEFFGLDLDRLARIAMLPDHLMELIYTQMSLDEPVTGERILLEEMDPKQLDRALIQFEFDNTKEHGERLERKMMHLIVAKLKWMKAHQNELPPGTWSSHRQELVKAFGKDMEEKRRKELKPREQEMINCFKIINNVLIKYTQDLPIHDEVRSLLDGIIRKIVEAKSWNRYAASISIYMRMVNEWITSIKKSGVVLYPEDKSALLTAISEVHMIASKWPAATSDDYPDWRKLEFKDDFNE